MPERARRVGRMVGRRDMAERLRWLQVGWPREHAELCDQMPWLLELG